MRRALLTAAGVAALTLTIPGAASASHGHHHKAKRRAHHAKVRFEHFGPATASTVGSGTQSDPSSTAVTPNPSTTTQPTGNENAGKVASYTGGVLTLTLNDGSSVSGKVTNQTQIECVSATPTSPSGGSGDDENSGDDNGAGDDQSQGDQQEGDQQPPAPVAGSQQNSPGDDNGDGSDDQSQTTTSEPPCDTSALITGAIVRAAELRIGPSGAEFESLVLVR